MIVEGRCRKCAYDFDAHWSKYPDLSTTEAILKPYCPKCKSLEVTTWTDESNDDMQGDDYDSDEYSAEGDE
jgi:hypothetical protein